MMDAGTRETEPNAIRARPSLRWGLAPSSASRAGGVRLRHARLPPWFRSPRCPGSGRGAARAAPLQSRYPLRGVKTPVTVPTAVKVPSPGTVNEKSISHVTASIAGAAFAALSTSVIGVPPSGVKVNVMSKE